jgi:hypothetical protein|nr:MAG TPA: hemolysin [Caudoviricetes sp.]
MTVKETLEQIKKELFLNLENMRNQIERLDDKITSIRDEAQKDQKGQEKDLEHFKERVNLKIENMQNNIEWINKYTDNNRSDKKERKQNILTIIGIAIAVIIGILNFCGITLQSVVKYF